MPSSPSISSKPHFPSAARIEPKLGYRNPHSQSPPSTLRSRLTKAAVLGLLIAGLGYASAKVLHDLFYTTSVPLPGNGTEESYHITSQDALAANENSNVPLFHRGDEANGPHRWIEDRDPDRQDKVAVGEEHGFFSLFRWLKVLVNSTTKGDTELGHDQTEAEPVSFYDPASSFESDTLPLYSSSKIDETLPRGELWKRERLTSSSAADIALCGMSPCRVLLPGWIGGDGVQAQQQLVQLGRLTTLMNDAYRWQNSFSRGIVEEIDGLASTMIDRTVGPYVLVLPNISKGRMGSCSKQPFEFYFDASPEVLARSGITRTATYEQFLHWVSTREVRPKVQIMFIQNEARDASTHLPFGSEVQEIWPTSAEQGESPAEILYDYDFPPDAPKHNYCLHQDPRVSRLVFHGRRPETTVYPPVMSKGSESVVKAAILEAFGFRRAGRGEATYVNVGYAPDVYVVDWELKTPVFKRKETVGEGPDVEEGEQPTEQTRFRPLLRSEIAHSKSKNIFEDGLAYHPTWTKLAENATSSLSPYLAVHWPIDAVSAPFLTSCATLLIRTLIKLLRKPDNEDVRTVYLATGGRVLSDSDLGLPSPAVDKGVLSQREHGDGDGGDTPVMRVLLEAFGDGGLLEGYSLTGVRGLLGEVRDDDGVRLLDEISLDEFDPGTLAMLDSKMAEKADLFVSGTARCGRRSSFVKRIVESRKAEEGLRNIEKTFG